LPAVTARPVDPVTEPCFAEIVVDCPEVTPVANPFAPIVAAVAFEEDHVTELVRSCVLLSENVPVALNCKVEPTATEEFAGVMAMETSVAAVTLRPVDPVTEPCFAEIVVDCPEVTPVANPFAPIVAAVAFEEDHVTELVRSCVLLSENVPTARNGTVAPAAMEGFVGVRAMDTREGDVTDTSAWAVVEPTDASITAVPELRPVATPAGVIASTTGLDDVQFAVDRDARLPSEYSPVAENVRLAPLGMVPAGGDMAIEVSVGADEPGDTEQPAKISGTPTKMLAIRTSDWLDILHKSRRRETPVIELAILRPTVIP
jgi:hypothetical protein